MRNRRNNSSIMSMMIFVGLIAGALYVYFSDTFEREAPQVSLSEQSRYWNLKKPLHLTLEDTSGIKSYRVVLKTSKGETTLIHEQPLAVEKKVELEIAPPRGSTTIKDKSITIIVQAQDASKWNLFNGNEVIKSYKFTIDKKRPKVAIINNSYKIQRGGSALVIFKVDDENLDEIYILSNRNKHFKAEPFYQEGYYIALLAWPVKDSGFKATVVA
ncbi:MAG: M23 family peptidase, partial [Sulfurimonas sp.]